MLSPGPAGLETLAEQPWGSDVGWLTDKFGINWMVNTGKA